MDSHPTLCEAIARHITTSPQQKITFAEYMDLVLYHPQYGYYSTQAAKLGKEGDFFTSVHLGADFGELLAEQFVQMWELLGKPEPFHLVEMGAGQGYLALDILKYIQQQYPDFFQCLDYIIVERSLTLRQIQQEKLLEFPVNWQTLEIISSNSIIGCFFSNELVDAMPVHQFTIHGGELQEIYVTTRELAGDKERSKFSQYLFAEVTGEPSTPQLHSYFESLGIDIYHYPDEYQSEVNLAALQWLSIVADRLQRGYVLTIDYGYSDNRYYNPRRSQGTLQCYWHHQRHNNPYINIGQQDITAHVDFTALEKWGDRCGLKSVGFTQQGLFLMALGLGQRIASLSYTEQPISQVLHRRDSLHQLLDPLGLGGFGVLLQTKGLQETDVSQPLKGFIIPESA
ncbi:class I SAM-dependent methyltransferase [Calothrix rhizosoleniae]|uniref:class I SAM-dependent methyltransferase n=1 Tax=Calothrix rhizosoleniae TaxID=888997 RepID=UPI000B4A31E3|nr:class I SAM-dependent methyltransferase [Calothrix rhizosoleniae]